MVSLQMGASGIWRSMARTGHEVPLWPIGPEFWMLIEQNPDIEYNLIAAALADTVTRLKQQWFYEEKNYTMRV
eukprot:11217193-Prorocentrum_lima.AAC.1